MKLIVLGDIHGNLPALEKCLTEARREGYDRILHTGDLVGYGPFPHEVVQLLRRERVDGVRGNWDEGVAWQTEGPGPVHPDPARREALVASFPWTREAVNPITRNILGNLPFEMRFRDSGMSFLAVHANPVDNTTYLREDADDLTFQEFAKAGRADAILFGHTHRFFHRQYRTTHFISAGSVGLPDGKDLRTGYTVIYTGNIGKGVDVNFRRFEYDSERVRRRSRERMTADPFDSLLSHSA
jgi:putative phosphoesterase